MHIRQQPWTWRHIMTTVIGLLALVYAIGVWLAPGHVLHARTPVHPAPASHHGTAVFVIHLDRAKDRLAFMRPQLQALGLPTHWVYAVDGHNLNQRTIDRVVSKKAFARTMHTGAIGCSLSHFKAYRAFLNSHAAYALILEDDVSFDPKKLRSAVRALTKQSMPWDLISFNNGQPHLIGHDGFTHIKLHEPNVALTLAWQKHENTGGYLINRHAATQLLKHSLPIQMPLDLYNRRDWEMHFIALESAPELIKQTLGTSDRLTSKNIVFEEMQHGIKHAFFAQKTAWMRFLYHTKLYLKYHAIR